MPEKYQDYLAASVLSDGNIISYRSLSRALKVHSNAAKEMLYDFYNTQNARKPGSIHATYLISGTRNPQPTSLSNGNHQMDGEDRLMSDDSFMMSSSIPAQEVEVESIPITTLTLVAEEKFEETKSLYEKITSIHIYSLEPGPLSNIGILSDCNRKIAVECATEDPLETWKVYGTIHNPTAKRRTSRRAPPPTVAKPPIGSTAPTTKAVNPPGPALKTERSVPEGGKSETAKAPQAKRGHADFFKSFAKDKPAGEQRTGSHSVAPGSLGPSKPEPPTAEDVSMKGIPDVPSEADDEGEGEEESEETAAKRDADAAASREKADLNRKAKLAREANLRKLMDDDDNDADVIDAKDAEGDEAMTEANSPEAEAEAEADVDQEPDASVDVHTESQQQQAQYTVSNGRRRGRRRVMKKKTTKDAEGYLVTREEPVWESFSEDEPVAPPPVKAHVSASANANTNAHANANAKGKKVGAAGSAGQGQGQGQGNIMSFFGKK